MTNRSYLAGAASAAIALAMASSAARAAPQATISAEPQTGSQPAPTVSEDQGTIIVTGTRSQGRTVASSLAPIDVLSKGELQATGKQSVRDVLGTLVPSISVASSGGGASYAVKTITLRGLSGDQVLVLVNGKRRHNTATLFVSGTTQSGQSPPDLDLIPSSSVDHIEVLRDGAAAQYGSDAIAGVINIILKSDLSGGASLLYGQSARGDGKQGRAQGDFGLGFANGARLHMAGDTYIQGRTNRSGPSNIQFFDTIGGVADPREATVDRNVNRQGQPQVVGFNLSYDATTPIGPDVELYSFGTGSRRKADAFLTFRAPRSANNVPQIYPFGYSPNLILQDTDYQFAGGVKGSGPAGIHFDLSTTYSEDMVDFNESSALNASLGPLSPTSFFIGTNKISEWTTNLDLQKPIDLGLADPLSVAVGAEYRRNTYEIDAGDVASYADGGYRATTGSTAGVVRVSGSQGVTGFPPDAAGKFKRHSWSGYINLEQKIVEGVDVALAGRHEDYSDFGTTNIGKASFRIEPVHGFAVRGTASTGFRAPTLQQEHYASSSTTNVVINGVTTLLPVQALPVSSAAGIALGAVPLKPEKSTSFSAGFVATPSSRLNLTVDAYQIRIRDRILRSSPLTGTTVLRVLAASGITSSAGGYYFSNAASTRTRGLDIVGTYRANLGDVGLATFSLAANFNKTIFTKVAAPPATLAAAGLVLIGRDRIGDYTVGTPRHKYIASATLTHGPASLLVRTTYYGSVTSSSTTASLDEVAHGKAIVDLEASYEITKGVRFAVGSNNLLNTYPTKIEQASNTGNNYTIYNVYSPFGFSGGFYYGKMTFSF